MEMVYPMPLINALPPNPVFKLTVTAVKFKRRMTTKTEFPMPMTNAPIPIEA